MNDHYQIDMGGGSDTVTIDGTVDDPGDIPDDLEISTGPGNDTVTLLQVSVADDTRIDTGTGADTVVVNKGTTFRSVFQDAFRVETGSGDGFVNLCTSIFNGVVAVDLEGGNDRLCVCGSNFNVSNVLSNVEFDGGSGTNDRWVIESVNGIAPPGVLGDFVDHFEFEVDDCSFLGGEACSQLPLP